MAMRISDGSLSMKQDIPLVLEVMGRWTAAVRQAVISQYEP